jgi:hypothetical protein
LRDVSQMVGVKPEREPEREPERGREPEPEPEPEPQPEPEPEPSARNPARTQQHRKLEKRLYADGRGVQSIVLVLPVHLLTARHAALNGRHLLSKWMILQTAAALNFWRQPELGVRRNIDMLCTTATSLWFTRLGFLAGGWQYLIVPFSCFLLSWACTYTGHELAAMRLWILLHISCFYAANVVLLRAASSVPRQAGLLAAARSLVAI